MTSSCFQHYIIQFYFEADQEIERYTGVPIQIVDESGRVIFKDRRNVAFDRNGEMAWEHGSHPSFAQHQRAQHLRRPV